MQHDITFDSRMKNIRLIYPLILGLFLFKGYNQAFAGIYQYSFAYSPDNGQKLHIAGNNDQQQETCLFSDNLIDDDEDPIQIKKKTSSPHHFPQINHTLFLSHLFSLKDNSRLCKSCCYLSLDRYIFQRVLRI